MGTNVLSPTSARWGTTAGSSALASGSVLAAAVSSLGILSFLPKPKREVRLRDALLDLVFLAFLSSSEELLEEEPVRAGPAVSDVAAAASPSASLGVTSRLFLGAGEAATTTADLAMRC